MSYRGHRGGATPEDVHARIEELVAEEHRLWELEGSGKSGDDDRERLANIKIELDRYWDLLRRRRAAAAVVYRELLGYVVQTGFSVDRAYPIAKPQEDPPWPTRSEDYWVGLKAEISAVGSHEVLAAVEEFSRRATAFLRAAGTWKAMPDPERRTRAGRGSDLTAAHEAMEKARADVRTQARVVERLVREELATL